MCLYFCISRSSPPYVDRIWLWVYDNKIHIPAFYLLKGDYTHIMYTDRDCKGSLGMPTEVFPRDVLPNFHFPRCTSKMC